MTHSNKSHNPHRSKPHQSQTGPRDRPQIGHKHRPWTVIGSPRHRQSGSPRRATPRLGGLESQSSLSPGSLRRACPLLGGPLRLSESSLILGEEPTFHGKKHRAEPENPRFSSPNRPLNEKCSFSGPKMESKLR